MSNADLTIEQLSISRHPNTGAKVVGRSANVRFDLEEFALRTCVKFGRRPDGVRCPEAVFALPCADSVAIAIVRDENPESPDATLLFRYFFVAKSLYTLLGDPFEIVNELVKSPDATTTAASLPTLQWPEQPLPPRLPEQILWHLKQGDSALLLGAAQALLDGCHVAIHRTAPDPHVAPAVWQMLPYKARAELWPAAFCFELGLPFDLMTVAQPTIPKQFLDEEQTKDYPPGRYELALQLAAEENDTAALQALFARRSSQEVLRLAAGMVLFAVVVAIVLKFV